jgi:ferredoxin
VPECPAEAIYPEAPELLKWVEINREYAKKWPVITKKKDAPADAKDFDGMKNKFEKLFDPRPFSEKK